MAGGAGRVARRQVEAQSSRPVVASFAWKKRRPRTSAKSLGEASAPPGLRSVRRLVPAGVPSQIHSSSPASSAAALNQAAVAGDEEVVGIEPEAPGRRSSPGARGGAVAEAGLGRRPFRHEEAGSRRRPGDRKRSAPAAG